ncbi:MAG: urease accessory protein UreF [Bosea sp. (in: a-proteobacteria)]
MNASPLLLMTWFSPSYPVGAFAYSHGLEWAQEAGDLTDAPSLQGWLTDLIELGAARNDAILLSESLRAVRAEQWPDVSAIAELCLAMAASTERRMETVTQGNAFVLASRAAHPCEALEQFRAIWPGDVPYPVAVAVTAAGHDIALPDLLPAFVLGFSANLVSAAVRLGIVGQTDGQRVLAGLMPAISALAKEAEARTLDDLGTCAFRSDIASLRHETQYSRLFRS